MVVQTSRRSFMGGMAATAAALLPVAAIARDADGGSEGLAYRTAGDLVKAIAGRQVSSRELVDSAISRIEALDPKINAVVVRDFERARAAADAADAALAKGENRALLGVPMTVKEQYAVAGLPTTRGDPKYKDWKAEVDALVVQRLKAAGAIILGKTNVPLNLSDWQSFNEVYGTTNNPWNLSRTPGGSSGGSAAALAAGFVPLELGSDIGGSLRAPAHFCGVFSHKPTLDLVPQRGSGPPQIPAVPVRGDLAVYGPMARSAADLALELEVLAGPDELMEGVGYKLELPPPRHEKLADFRVLVIDTHPLPDRGQHQGLAERARRSSREAWLPGSAPKPEATRPGANNAHLWRTASSRLQPGFIAGRPRTNRRCRQNSVTRRSKFCRIPVARHYRQSLGMDPREPRARNVAGPMVQPLSGGRYRAMSTDAEPGLPARPHSAAQPSARYRWQQNPL
jgi:hypothetical protein